MLRKIFRSSGVALALACATAAQAHPKLVASTPAANATVVRPTTLELRFSEKLAPKFSGAELTMTGMPGMASHPPMKIAGWQTNVGPDGKTLILTGKTPLASGTYQLAWHVVAADTHRITGTLAFAVK